MNNFYLLTGAVLSLFFCIFSIVSFRENKARAGITGFVTSLLIALLWFAPLMFFEFSTPAFLIPSVSVYIIGILFFMPVGKTAALKINPTTERVDERDTMFARDEYIHDKARFESYYSMRPDKKRIDDKIRKLPEMFGPGGRYYDQISSGYIRALFKFEERLTTHVDGPVNRNKVEISPGEAAKIVKDVTLHLGAEDAGIAKLNQNYVYSHVGRGPDKWGSEVNNRHEYVIVFSVEMNYKYVEGAPEISITEETALQYLNTQKISIALAEFIRELGYSARAHVPGSNYQVMLPPVAFDAGLGELGRLGYLITPRFGARIRLGAVTTDMPMQTDKPVVLGVQEFCAICKKCADNCPSGSISYGNKTEIRGVERWPVNIEKCFQYWRIIGTDCGLCMKVCPFSHPDNLVHNILREGIKRSAFARRVSLYGDDLFYGRKVKFMKSISNNNN